MMISIWIQLLSAEKFIKYDVNKKALLILRVLKGTLQFYSPNGEWLLISLLKTVKSK